VLTISDLAVVEAVVQVDETDVPEISLQDSASVSIDAFPQLEFAGRITEIGNSAIQPPSSQSSNQQAAIDFEVVVTLTGPPVELRPDLSATAEIVTETRHDALSIPIIALTVRDRSAIDSAAVDEAGADEEFDDVEGVFVVEDGMVQFRPIEVGIAGVEYFEVISGLEEGETVVAGPYQVIRQLQPGDAVQEADGEIPGG
jgi:HlyD family secretion protein